MESDNCEPLLQYHVLYLTWLLDQLNIYHVLATSDWFNIYIYIYLHEIKLLNPVTCHYRLPTHSVWSHHMQLHHAATIKWSLTWYFEYHTPQQHQTDSWVGSDSFSSDLQYLFLNLLKILKEKFMCLNKLVIRVFFVLMKTGGIYSFT